MAAGDVNTRVVSATVDSGGDDTFTITATANHKVVGVFPYSTDPNVVFWRFDFGASDGATCIVHTKATGPVTSGDSDVYSVSVSVTEVAQA